MAVAVVPGYMRCTCSPTAPGHRTRRTGNDTGKVIEQQPPDVVIHSFGQRALLLVDDPLGNVPGQAIRGGHGVSISSSGPRSEKPRGGSDHIGVSA